MHATLRGPSPLAPFRPYPSRLVMRGDVLLFAGGPPARPARVAFVLGPTAPDDVLALAAAHFGAPDAFDVCVEVEAAPAVDEALRTAGWRLDEEEPALVLPDLTALAERVPPPPADLDIRRVVDAAGFAAFRGLAGTSEHGPPSLEAAVAPGVALFVGYLDGRPAATARLACVGHAGAGARPPAKVGDLTGIRTLPEFRRRGIATAMTWAAVAEAAAQGCAAAVAFATAMGYPVYVRMGFVPVATYRTYAQARGS